MEDVMVRRFQRGEGKFGCIVGVGILVIALFIAAKVLPKRIAVASMQDYIEETADKTSLLNPKEGCAIPCQLTELFYKKAKEEGLPIPKEAIKVALSNGRVSVEIQYRLDIDLLVTTYQWNVEHKVERLTF
jgi:hypothetical protein